MAYRSIPVVVRIGELGVKDQFPASVVQALAACTASALLPWHFGPNSRYELCIRHDRHFERVPKNLTWPFAIIDCSILSRSAFGSLRAAWGALKGEESTGHDAMGYGAIAAGVARARRAPAGASVTARRTRLWPV
jgi:hypothetical protein